MSMRRLRVLMRGAGYIATPAPVGAPAPSRPQAPAMTPISDVRRFLGGLSVVDGG